MRVWHIARHLHMDSKSVIEMLANVGVHVRNPSSLVEPICAQAFIAHVSH